MKQKKSVMRVFLEGAAAVAVLLMLGIFPLYYQNNYINMSNAKLAFFRVCSIGLVLAVVLFLCMDWLQQYKEKMQPKNKKKKVQAKKGRPQMGKGEALRQWLGGISATTWLAVIFVVGILASTLFSANPQESWLGQEGRKLGAITWLLCVAMYGLIGKYLRPGKWTAWVFLAANSLICLLAILNFWQIDPLGMYENLAVDQHAGFISTIGNINACAGYLCMTVPAGMALYTAAKDIYLRAASAIFLVLGFCAGYCAHSDSWVIGLMASFLVLLWFAMRGHEHMQKFLEICGIFWIASILMKIQMIAGDIGTRKTPMYKYLSVDKLHIMLNGYVLAAEGILIAAALFLVWNRKKSGKEIPYRMVRKCMFIVFVAVAVIGLLIFAMANLNKAAWEGSLAVLERFRLQDSFGSGRGYIWRITMECWLGLPLWDKIVGYGVNCYHMFIQQYGGPEVAEFFGGALLVDAHNELLQILTTMGVLGVVGYFGLQIGTAVRSAKRISVKPSLLLGVLVVCGYMAQGLVNNPTIFLTPFLFLMLGIIKSMERTEDAEA